MLNRFTFSGAIFASVIGLIGYYAEPVDVQPVFQEGAQEFVGPRQGIPNTNQYADFRPTYQQGREEERIKQLSCLAMTIHSEAKGETHRGMLMVGEVIRNRVESNRYPDSYCEVVVQPWQFSAWNTGNPSGEQTVRAFMKVKPSNSVLASIKAAQDVMSGESQILDSRSMYYHTDQVSPKWSQSAQLRYTTQEGAHKFYLRP